MPFSRNVFDLDFLLFLKARSRIPKRFLDIGCGAGKYGAIIKKQFDKTAWIEGIEIDAVYIKKYKLKALYTVIKNIDASTIPDRSDIAFYDISILGDIIEHLRKSDGIDLINFLIYHSEWIWIVYPDHIPQTDYAHPSENHRSLWSIDDFQSQFGQFIYTHHNRDHKNLIVLRGIFNNETFMNIK